MPVKTLADKLASKFVGHDINLMRLEATQRRMILRALKQLELELEARIQKVGRGVDTFSVARSRALLREATAAIEDGYTNIYNIHKDLLKDLGKYELEASAKVVNRQIGVNLLSVGVPDSVIDSLVSDATVQGFPLKSFWDQQSLSLRNRFATEMRAGVFAGDTTQRLIQRVRGTQANGFKDGIMRTSRNQAETLVRTGAQSILNDSRMAMFKANADVIEGVQAQVTLDERTSDICMARSGFAWTLDGDPMKGTDTDEDFPGPPPWHPNCRTTLIPIVKKIGTILNDPSLDAKVEREVDKLPKATQSSMTGQVAGDLTYEDWLRDQDKTTQLEILGPGRYELWSKGKISLRDLIDQRGRPLTLRQLQRIEA